MSSLSWYKFRIYNNIQRNKVSKVNKVSEYKKIITCYNYSQGL